MSTRLKHALLVVPAIVALPHGPRELATDFIIRIENVSTESTLQLSNGKSAPAPTSPGVWAVFRGTANPIFATGQPASRALEAQAEEGNPEKLAAFLKTSDGAQSSGSYSIPKGDREAGPLLPGKAYELHISAQPGDRLVLAFMFGQSNDLFYAPQDAGIALFEGDQPLHGDITSQFELWDAGTEKNQEPGLGADQAPRQKGPNSGEAEHGVVGLVKDSFTYPATNQVIRVTITSKPGK